MKMHWNDVDIEVKCISLMIQEIDSKSVKAIDKWKVNNPKIARAVWASVLFAYWLISNALYIVWLFGNILLLLPCSYINWRQKNWRNNSLFPSSRSRVLFLRNWGDKESWNSHCSKCKHYDWPLKLSK